MCVAGIVSHLLLSVQDNKRFYAQKIFIKVFVT